MSIILDLPLLPPGKGNAVTSDDCVHTQSSYTLLSVSFYSLPYDINLISRALISIRPRVKASWWLERAVSSSTMLLLRSIVNPLQWLVYLDAPAVRALKPLFSTIVSPASTCIWCWCFARLFDSSFDSTYNRWLVQTSRSKSRVAFDPVLHTRVRLEKCANFIRVGGYIDIWIGLIENEYFEKWNSLVSPHK